MIKKLFVGIVLLVTSPGVIAHHNPVVYDGKTTVKISGVVKAAYFGYPHSRFAINVTRDDGTVERWTLMTEDPRDARRLGFEAEIKAIRRGDTITVVGWPNKMKAREIRGHQLHYDDGRVVMMRRGNYIWTAALRRIFRLRSDKEDFPDDFTGPVATSDDANALLAWIREDDVVPRIAYEIVNDNARLIGIDTGSGITFPGVQEAFLCHAERKDFRREIELPDLAPDLRDAIAAGDAYIRRFNDLLSRYWEYDVSNC